MMEDNRLLQLTKHHGTGNDFLVVADVDDRKRLAPELIRALCDRRFGIGADGVIRILAGRDGSDLSMDLSNADGSKAEMSGNGIRCLAQAAVDAGLVTPPVFSVWTPAGIRNIEYRKGDSVGQAVASVDMGKAELGPDQPQNFTDRRARTVNMGNPHLVLLGPDPSGVDVSEIGSRLQGVHPGGINVEFISVGASPDDLTLRVWERGAGQTESCGTGSCAAAAAARSWGLVGERIRVHNPGGTLEVTLNADGIRLAGPTCKVADIVISPSGILGGTRR